MHEAYRPISLMTALWPTMDYQFPEDVDALAGRLRQQFPLFEEARLGTPPGGAPQAEWPYLTLIGEQRQWTLEMAPGKLGLRQSAGPHLGLDELFARQYAVLSPLQSWLSENHDFRPYRMGVAIHIFCNTRSSANEKIMSYFLQPRATQGQVPYDVQLGLLTRINLYENVMVNRWLRVRPLRTIDARHVDFAAQVEVDINTMAEDTQLRTARDVGEFLEAVRDHLEHDIPLLVDGDFVE